MNTKTFLPILLMLLSPAALFSQIQETTDSLTRELEQVVVTTKQPATKLVGTTLVSTIAGSNLSRLGTALNVLAQLPMISVTDGDVSVIGKSGVEIYIDGRPLRSGELEQLLSGDVRRVELLMSPGADYASTTGAVIKITTRRNFVKGLTLTDRFQAKRGRRWSAMDYLDLTYRSGGWDMFLSGVINRDDFVNKGTTTNTLTWEGRPVTIGSSQRNSCPTLTGMVKGGFNYAFDNQSVGGYYQYNPEKGSFTNRGTEWMDRTVPLERNIYKDIRAHSHSGSVYYENRFSELSLLHFDGDVKRSVSCTESNTLYPLSSAPSVASTDSRRSLLLAGKLYLTAPLWDGALTLGTQDSYTHTRLDYRMLNQEVEHYIPSSMTDARQTSAALFASWARQLGKFSLSAGARYEYDDYDFKVNGKRDEDVSRRDHLLTPDISLGYTFAQDGQISLSYKLATVKSPYSQLTGSLTYVGQHEIEGGNPALRDERMHTVQLFGMWKGFMLQAAFTRALDTYAFVKQIYPATDLQLLMHPVNIDVSALSLYLVWSKPMGRWTPNLTAGMYRQWLEIDRQAYHTPIFSYYLDNAFALPRGWTLTANIYGSSEGDMHTNRFGATWFAMNASVGKTLLNKSLTLKLEANDIFNTANNDWTMNTYGVFVDKRQSYDRRNIALSLIYNFQPRKSRYKGSAASEAELRRLP